MKTGRNQIKIRMSDEVPVLRCTSSRKEFKYDANHKADRCMSCDAPPEYEVLWAEGMAHAWFCETHLREWLKESVASCAKEGFSNKNCGVNSVKELDNNEASKKFKDNKNTNILNSFLSEISMPKVNKEKKKEKEEAWEKQESVGLRDDEKLAHVNSPNEYSIDAEVQDVHEVKDGNSWNYGCSINDINGRDVAIGRTDNTDIKVKEGDIIKVTFLNLNKYFDTKRKKVWYNWWSPRDVMARTDKKRPDNIDTADKLVKASHGEDKNRRSNIELDADVFMSPPDEDKKWLGALTLHGRGRSIHGDLMFQASKDWAIKWTLYIPKGLSKAPSSYSEFVELVKKEVLPVVEAKLKDPTKRFNCGKSDPKPAEWLDFKGMVEKGESGATENEPGFFYIADRFEVEFGAMKPHYCEYFCTGGRLLNGRFCMRLLENKEEWTRTDEGLMTWMAVATKEKTPYVISKRAVAKKWIPGFGYSALPKKMRLKVPEKYRYWRYKETSKQREIRDELMEELGKTLVAQDALGPAIYKVFRQTSQSARTRYYFAICQETKGNVKFALATQSNPLENKELACVKYEHAIELCNLNAKLTEVKPKTTEETPSKIELLERGKASILSNTNFRRFKLRDGKLEGSWIAFQREEGSTIWTLKRANPE